jgi:ribokinase
MENFDLISIGDATIDVFLAPTESDLLCNLNDKDCQIAFTYGAKIPVKSLEFSIGGNAANNAIGAKRLGIKTAILSSIGDDGVATMIQDRLVGEEVDVHFMNKQLDSRSNYSTIITYGGERTIFTYHAPRVYEFPQQLPVPSWVYLTSMGESFRPFFDQFVVWLKNNPTVKVAFNPGSWQMKSGVESIKDILFLTSVLFVNRQEAEKLTGMTSTEGKERDLLFHLSQLGVKIPVVTDGNNGSYAFDGQKFFRCGVLPIDAYERTGAGDAFGSGCLSAIIKGKSLQDALVWGTVNSASVIGFVGSQKGLLKEAQLQEWLDRAQSSQVKVEEF